MSSILHRLITAEEWREAKRVKRIAPSAMDIESGFVHLSLPSQSPKTAELYFPADRQPLILEIDASRLTDKLRWEYVSSRMEEMPHLYRELQFDDLLGVRCIEFTEAGVLVGSLCPIF